MVCLVLAGCWSDSHDAVVRTVVVDLQKAVKE